MVSGIKVAPSESIEKLQIFTFGQFMVKSGKMDYFEKATRSHKRWELFKYLLTHKDKLLSAEVIAETLWPDQEYADTKGSMRVQVHRIRQLFLKNFPSRLPLDIFYSQGCYSLKLRECWLDADEFGILSRQAHELSRHNPEEKIALCVRAIALYKGDYLTEITSGWVLPVRSYYRRLYLKNVLTLAELLKEAGRYSELTETLEKAFIIEPFEEELHISYMEALLEGGKATNALSHYEYITSALYQEKGAKPSSALREMYRSIKRAHEKVFPDYTDLHQMLNEQEDVKGPMPCEIDFFQFLCNLQRRAVMRAGNPAYVTFLTLTTNELMLLPLREVKRLMDQLEQVLLNNLRPGDVFCKMGESQFALLLQGLNLKQAQKVLQRICKKHRELFGHKGMALRSTALPLLPPKQA